MNNTPMNDHLDKIDDMLLKQVAEIIRLAKKQRKQAIKAYIDRGVYE